MFLFSTTVMASDHDHGITLVTNRTTTAIVIACRRRIVMATIDARPLIAAGDEPFDLIMTTVATLGEHEDLVVLAPFEPVPLEGVLGAQGFSYEAVELGADDWQVTFRRQS
jgi:uncharacterized protein (DUF2249 family)